MSSFVKKTLLIALLLLTVGACRGRETLQLMLYVDNAYAPQGVDKSKLPAIQVVNSFKVTVTGPDLEEGLVFNLSATNPALDLEEIPDGSARTILVEAFNSSGNLVRRNQITDVTIEKESLDPITISLNTVPLFTNLRNGNRVIVTRLQMLGVGEPQGNLEVEDSTDQVTDVLFDVAIGDTVVHPESEMGQFTFTPTTLALGQHTFTVLDKDTGEQSQVTVRLVPPGSLPGTGINSFGSISSTDVTTGGIPWFSFDVDLAHFPDVLTRSVQ